MRGSRQWAPTLTPCLDMQHATDVEHLVIMKPLVLCDNCHNCCEEHPPMFVVWERPREPWGKHFTLADSTAFFLPIPKYMASGNRLLQQSLAR